MKLSISHCGTHCAFAFIFVATSFSAVADELKDQFAIASDNRTHVLDLLMVAKAAPISTLSKMPVGWVYEVCKRPALAATSCPSLQTSPTPYGGTLLKLQPGDLMKIHLVNQLPTIKDSKHAVSPHEFLALNPTNLHTHGMLVSPHEPNASDPTWGDNVFVLTFNSINGTPTMGGMVINKGSTVHDSVVNFDSTDYTIQVPSSHPSGLFWFHPHTHGVSLNQVSAGLAGLITVGTPSDYICKTKGCINSIDNTPVRHILLKDAQIGEDNVLITQQDPALCDKAPAGNRLGSCVVPTAPSKNKTWYFTLNGQKHPTISVAAGKGEILRIANTSGSATYDLGLTNSQNPSGMLMQVLSIDGVSISPDVNATPGQLAAIAGDKFDAIPCPDSDVISATSGIQPLCTRKLLMMPSSRVEVWVTYRDSNGHAAPAPAGATANFQTRGYITGTNADHWPQIDLANVVFLPSQGEALSSSLVVSGQATALATPESIGRDLVVPNFRVPIVPHCKILPANHKRRIFFGYPTTAPGNFGLAYEEIDEKGNVVDENGNIIKNPKTTIREFDPMVETICVPLGPNNTPAVERWELINLVEEDHNFHLHQVKFRLLTNDELNGTVTPMGKGVELDNVRLLRAMLFRFGTEPAAVVYLQT